MSHPAGSTLHDRIEMQFVEADVEMAFTLLDLAADEWRQGHHAIALRVIENAEEAFNDIELRLARLSASVRMPFSGLVGELRGAIDEAKLRQRN